MKSNSNYSPKITIGIPTYNQSEFIGEAIQSVLDQDYPNIEIIIADDASTDSTFAIVEPFLNDKRVFYNRNEQNIGRVANYRQLLYTQATGDWYLNLDGDDRLCDAHFLSQAVQSFQTDTIFYQGFVATLQENGSVSGLNPRKKTEILRGEDWVKNYWSKPHFNHCGTVFNRQKALELGFYSHQALNSDFESLMRLALKGSVVISEKTVALWRSHGNNASNKQHIQLRNTPETETFERIAAATKEVWSEKDTQNWLKAAYNWHEKMCWFQRVQTDASWETWWALVPRAFRQGYYFKMTVRLFVQLVFGIKN